MNLSRFFIHRPIFAGVLSLLIFIGGALAVWKLPITEYPDVVPPTVVVTANYPGANPKVIGETVATPLEQEINGVEDMLYMSSQATSDGRMTLTVTFAIGTNPDDATTLVQNRVNRALPRLPQEVQRLGVVTEKSSPNLTMVVHLTSPDKRYDMLYLSNYADQYVKDELNRIEGVGSVRSHARTPMYATWRSWSPPRCENSPLAPQSVQCSDTVIWACGTPLSTALRASTARRSIGSGATGTRCPSASNSSGPTS